MCVQNDKGCDVGVKCGFRFVARMKNFVNILSKSSVIATQKMNKFQSMNTCLVELCNVFMVSCFILFNAKSN